MGNLVIGGLEGAGLRTGEKERRFPWISICSVYFLSSLFILGSIHLAQLESQISLAEKKKEEKHEHGPLW